MVLYRIVVETAQQGNKKEYKKHREKLKAYVIHWIGLVELIYYIDGSQSGTDIVSIYELAYIAKLYSKRDSHMHERVINITLLTNLILAAIEYIQEHMKGSVVLLIYNEQVRFVLQHALSYSCDHKGIITKAAKIVQRDMLDTKDSFTRTFNEGFQHESVQYLKFSNDTGSICHLW